MEPFATTADLEARWRKLSNDEKGRASSLLDDGAALLMSMLKRAGVEVDPDDELQAANLRSINCSMVQRSMSAAGDMYGVTQQTMTEGPF